MAQTPKRWRKITDTLIIGFTTGHGRRYHMSIEQVSETGRWVWVVWRAGHSGEWTQHGLSPSANAAKRAVNAAILADAPP